MAEAEIKLYTDYKSPYAFLAFDPVMALAERFAVRVTWKPFQLRIKGKGQRSVYSEYKVRYSYMDARRWANLRGGIVLRGPLKIYDTEPALIGGLFARDHGKLIEYSRIVYTRFFRRELEIDQAEAVADVLAELGLDTAAFAAYLEGAGKAEYEAIQAESAEDQIFGVPIMAFEKELFWGYDRIPLLEMRLREKGLERGASGP
ncbi:MAG: DsbA family protein [Rhodospirillales bacterium]|nr:DsbA family protein [Rhodospirillales bacterium]